MQFGRGQNKHQMGRRLLQNLQQRIECRCGQHVNLIHNIDPLTHRRRRIGRLVPQRANLIDPVVGGGVQF